MDSAKGEEIKGCVVQCGNKGSRGYESPCSHAEKALQGFPIIPSNLDTRLKSGGFYLRPRWVIRLKGPPEEDAHVPGRRHADERKSNVPQDYTFITPK